MPYYLLNIYYLIDWLNKEDIKKFYKEEKTIKQWVNIEKDALIYLLKSNKEKKERLLKVLSKFKEEIGVDINNIEDEIFEDVKFLIKNEVLFYDVINGIIKPTSIIEWHAIKDVLK